MPVDIESHFFVFLLGKQQYALPLASVERVVRAVYVTPLPGAPSVVLGVINVQGRVLPVLCMRSRFGLAQRKISINDQFVLASIAGHSVALVIDEAQNVIAHTADEIISSVQIAPGVSHIQSIVKKQDGLVLIHDLDKFLSLDEAISLDQAINAVQTHDA
jgi:purine-binding chemotaxis protein CheW